MWAYIAHKTNEEMHLKYLKELQKNLSSEDITNAEKQGMKIFKKVIKE